MWLYLLYLHSYPFYFVLSGNLLCVSFVLSLYKIPIYSGTSTKPVLCCAVNCTATHDSCFPPDQAGGLLLYSVRALFWAKTMVPLTDDSALLLYCCLVSCALTGVMLSAGIPVVRCSKCLYFASVEKWHKSWILKSCNVSIKRLEGICKYLEMTVQFCAQKRNRHYEPSGTPSNHILQHLSVKLSDEINCIWDIFPLMETKTQQMLSFLTLCNIEDFRLLL